MIETHHLKNVVIFIQTILSFVLSRKIVNFYNDIAWKYGNIRVKEFQNYEKLEYKKNKLKLDMDLLNNCKQLGVYPKSGCLQDIFSQIQGFQGFFLNFVAVFQGFW